MLADGLCQRNILLFKYISRIIAATRYKERCALYEVSDLKYRFAREWAMSEADTAHIERFKALDCYLSDTIVYADQVAGMRYQIEKNRAKRK